MELLARLFPSGLKATLNTAPWCLEKALIASPLSTCQRRTVESREPLARILPSGLKATL
jgi:hypothetical protein